MKILVTGGSGFIGSFLVSELQKDGHNVDILTNTLGFKHSSADVVHADITDRKKILKIIPNYDVVYHLAGLLGTSELITRAYIASQVNILGTINILDGALVNGTKVIDITKPNVWRNTYSITKYAGEEFSKMYYEQFGLPTVSIKWFNVYGPKQSFHCQKAVPFFIRWGLNGNDIQVWGNGKQTADFIHAVDAVRATILVAQKEELNGTTIDIGSGEETTVNKLASIIVNLTGNKSKIIHLPMRDGETVNTKLCADISVLKKYGFAFQYPNLKKGLKETVDWYKKVLK